MSAKQGLELIIDAARELRNAPHIHFIMCGEGPQKAALREMAADLTVVRFLDLQLNDRFAQLLITADIHIIAQRAEAADLVLPSKLGGILASGRPLIAMAAPGTGLANEIEGAGIAVPPGNANAFAEALRKLAVDETTRNVLGVGARQRAEERWNRTAIIQRLEGQLAEAAAGAGHRV